MRSLNDGCYLEEHVQELVEACMTTDDSSFTYPGKFGCQEVLYRFMGEKAGKLHPSAERNGHISPAELTIDEFDDVNLEQPTVDRSQPRTLVGKSTNDDTIMNDIMMNEIIGEDKAEDVDTVIEDAVSISTDVVEEVDEVELSRLQLQSEPRLFEKRHDDCLEDEKQLAISETKDDESSQASSLEYPSTSKIIENSIELKKDSTDTDEKVDEEERIDKDNSDLEEDDTSDAGPSSTAKKSGPNSALKEASTNSNTSKAEESEVESEEEVIIDAVQLDVQRNSPAKNIGNVYFLFSAF
uniref:MIF4G domain-containing protein n=1 Tax=Angiostrongylus cantonensis TaxID=6313 RepID=A0A0K0CWU6_ANGCA